MKPKRTVNTKQKRKTEKKPRRRLGMYRGKFKIADDFDASLPEEVLRAFEGRLGGVDWPQREK